MGVLCVVFAVSTIPQKQHKAHLFYPEGVSMQKKQTIFPLLLIGAGAILIFAVLIWQFAASSKQLPTAAPNIPYPAVQRVSLNDAKAALDRKEAVFVDVRAADVYQSNHIAGAISIPLDNIETRYRELNPNQWIILYCT
jgi:hypothetical protein